MHSIKPNPKNSTQTAVKQKYYKILQIQVIS